IYALKHRIRFGESELYEQSGLVRQKSVYYALFDVDSAIIMCDEVETATLGITRPEGVFEPALSDMVAKSRDLIKLLGDTSFRRASHVQQKTRYEALMSEASELVAGLVDAVIVVEFLPPDETTKQPSELPVFSPNSL